MKDLHSNFVKRVKGSETEAHITARKNPDGNIEYTAFTVYLRRDEYDRIQLLNITKYFWLQTEEAEAVPSLGDMKLSEISVFGDELPQFLQAVNDAVKL